MSKVTYLPSTKFTMDLIKEYLDDSYTRKEVERVLEIYFMEMAIAVIRDNKIIRLPGFPGKFVLRCAKADKNNPINNGGVYPYIYWRKGPVGNIFRTNHHPALYCYKMRIRKGIKYALNVLANNSVKYASRYYDESLVDLSKRMLASSIKTSKKINKHEYVDS